MEMEGDGVSEAHVIKPGYYTKGQLEDYLNSITAHAKKKLVFSFGNDTISIVGKPPHDECQFFLPASKADTFCESIGITEIIKEEKVEIGYGLPGDNIFDKPPYYLMTCKELGEDFVCKIESAEESCGFVKTAFEVTGLNRMYKNLDKLQIKITDPYGNICDPEYLIRLRLETEEIPDRLGL